MMMKTKNTDLTDKPLPPDLLRKMNAYWRAANYLSSGRFISTTIHC
jgi:xylulose-5-phosphate/fructose-6-phosphate phosphoketolase